MLSALERLDRRVTALEVPQPPEQALISSNFVAREGETVFVAAPTAGISGLLPAPRAQNRGARIVFGFTTNGPVRLTCDGGLINGKASLTSNVVGSFAAICDGALGWLLMPFVDPYAASPEASGLATPFAIRVAFSALGAGTADDVTIFNAAAPFAFRILDCFALISAAIGGSTVTLRSASGGGGSALSSALSSAATGTARNNDTTTRTVASGGSLFLRRSDRAVAGTIVVWCVRT